MGDYLLALVFLMFGAALWRNPRTHFPKAYRLFMENPFSAVYWCFPIISALFFAGAIFLVVRAVG